MSFRMQSSVTSEPAAVTGTKKKGEAREGGIFRIERHSLLREDSGYDSFQSLSSCSPSNESLFHGVFETSPPATTSSAQNIEDDWTKTKLFTMNHTNVHGTRYVHGIPDWETPSLVHENAKLVIYEQLLDQIKPDDPETRTVLSIGNGALDIELTKSTVWTWRHKSGTAENEAGFWMHVHKDEMYHDMFKFTSSSVSQDDLDILMAIFGSCALIGGQDRASAGQDEEDDGGAGLMALGVDILPVLTPLPSPFEDAVESPVVDEFLQLDQSENGHEANASNDVSEPAAYESERSQHSLSIIPGEEFSLAPPSRQPPAAPVIHHKSRSLPTPIIQPETLPEISVSETKESSYLGIHVSESELPEALASSSKANGRDSEDGAVPPPSYSTLARPDEATLEAGDHQNEKSGKSRHICNETCHPTSPILNSPILPNVKITQEPEQYNSLLSGFKDKSHIRPEIPYEAFAQARPQPTSVQTSPNLLAPNHCLGFGSGSVSQPTSPIAAASSPLPGAKTSLGDRYINGVSSGSLSLSKKITKSCTNLSEKITDAAEKKKATITPSADPTAVPVAAVKVFKGVELVSAGCSRATGGASRAVATAAVAAARKVEEMDAKSAQAWSVEPPTKLGAAKRTACQTFMAAGHTVIAAMRIAESLETGVIDVAKAGTGAIVDLVEHKKGEGVGAIARSTRNVLHNAVDVYQDVNILPI